MAKSIAEKQAEASRFRAMKKANTVAEYFAWQAHLSGKSNVDISRDAGLPKPNVIAMFKSGETKIPIERVGPLAKSIGVDAVHFFGRIMREYYPDTFQMIEKMFDQNIVLTDNEREILQVIRSADVENPKIRSEEDKQRLISVIESFKTDNAI